MHVMTTLFEELFKPDSRAYPKECKWIKSSDDVYTAEFELAGFSKKDVKITVNNEILRVEANKEDRMAWEINEIKPKFYTLHIKPVRKIGQFLKKK